MTDKTPQKKLADHTPQEWLKFWQQCGYIDAEVCRQTGLSPSTFRDYRRRHNLVRLTATPAGGPIESTVVPPDVALLQSRISTLEREKRRLLGLRALFERVVRESLAPVAMPKPPTLKLVRSHAEHVAYLLIGDVQGGSEIHDEETAGLEKLFNWEVIGERRDRLIQTCNTLVGDHRKSLDIRRLVVVWLGDMCEGAYNFDYQARIIEEDVTLQMVHCIETFVPLLQWASGAFDEVVNYSVCGNHGRERKSGLDMDYMVYWGLQMATRDAPNLRWVVTRGPFLAWEEADDFVYLANHGDSVQRNYSTPFYGLDRAFKQYLQLAGRNISTVFFGHHHESMDRSGDWMVNGAWPAASDYTVGRLRACNRPNQLLLLHHPKHGITHQHHVWLTDERPKLGPPDEHGVLTPCTQPSGAQATD